MNAFLPINKRHGISLRKNTEFTMFSQICVQWPSPRKITTCHLKRVISALAMHGTSPQVIGCSVTVRCGTRALFCHVTHCIRTLVIRDRSIVRTSSIQGHQNTDRFSLCLVDLKYFSFYWLFFPQWFPFFHTLVISNVFHTCITLYLSKHWVRFSGNVNPHSQAEMSGNVSIVISGELPLLKFTCGSCRFLLQLYFFIIKLNCFHFKGLRVRPVALACWKAIVRVGTFQVSHIFLPVHIVLLLFWAWASLEQRLLVISPHDDRYSRLWTFYSLLSLIT